jgi:phage recombination protein Bet
MPHTIASQPRALALVDDTSFREKLDAYKKAYAANLTDAELFVFGEACRRMGLDPFARQIYVFKSSGKGMQTMVSIDGLRSIAERSEKYAGQVGPFWCGPDGVWHDAWIADEAPVACKVGVKRRDFDEVMWGVARFKSFKKSSETWASMPDVMLAVRAETQALRRTFPNQLGGVYTPGEMGYAEEPAANYIEADPEPEPEPAARTVESANPYPDIDDSQISAKSRELAKELGISNMDYGKAFYVEVNDGKPISPKDITRAQRERWYTHLLQSRELDEKSRTVAREINVTGKDYDKSFYANASGGKPVEPADITLEMRKMWLAYLLELRAKLAEEGVEDYEVETPTAEIEHELSTLDPREMKVS